MVDLDSSTPQLKVVKNLLNALTTLDVNNAGPYLSKNYQYEPLPESAELGGQTKEKHLQSWGEIFSSVKKFEVRI